MTNKDDIQSAIIDRLTLLLGCGRDRLGHTTLLQSLGMDSMRFIELFVFIENEFGVELLSANLQREDLETPQALALAVYRNM